MTSKAIRAIIIITTTFIWAAVLYTAFRCAGCTVIWHDDVFIGTLFKEVDANDLDMIAEPNYLQIGSGDSRTKNDKIKASTVVGGVPVIIESK